MVIRMSNTVKTQEEMEQEMLTLNQQFSEFLHTKGIVAKFKLAFNNMGESARKQHQKNVEEFEVIKAKSAEENKEFVEFLHTKGIKAKFHLIIENIKKGIANAPANTAAQIAKINAQTQASIAHSRSLANPQKAEATYSAESLTEDFNEFLKLKGLDGKYTVVIEEK